MLSIRDPTVELLKKHFEQGKPINLHYNGIHDLKAGPVLNFLLDIFGRKLTKNTLVRINLYSVRCDDEAFKEIYETLKKIQYLNVELFLQVDLISPNNYSALTEFIQQGQIPNGFILSLSYFPHNSLGRLNSGEGLLQALKGKKHLRKLNLKLNCYFLNRCLVSPIEVLETLLTNCEILNSISFSAWEFSEEAFPPEKIYQLVEENTTLLRFVINAPSDYKINQDLLKSISERNQAIKQFGYNDFDRLINPVPSFFHRLFSKKQQYIFPKDIQNIIYHYAFPHPRAAEELDVLADVARKRFIYFVEDEVDRKSHAKSFYGLIIKNEIYDLVFYKNKYFNNLFLIYSTVFFKIILDQHNQMESQYASEENKQTIQSKSTVRCELFVLSIERLIVASEMDEGLQANVFKVLDQKENSSLLTEHLDKLKTKLLSQSRSNRSIESKHPSDKKYIAPLSMSERSIIILKEKFKKTGSLLLDESQARDIDFKKIQPGHLINLIIEALNGTIKPNKIKEAAIINIRVRVPCNSLYPKIYETLKRTKSANIKLILNLHFLTANDYKGLNNFILNAKIPKGFILNVRFPADPNILPGRSSDLLKALKEAKTHRQLKLEITSNFLEQHDGRLPQEILYDLFNHCNILSSLVFTAWAFTDTIPLSYVYELLEENINLEHFEIVPVNLYLQTGEKVTFDVNPNLHKEISNRNKKIKSDNETLEVLASIARKKMACFAQCSIVDDRRELYAQRYFEIITKYDIYDLVFYKKNEAKQLFQTHSVDFFKRIINQYNHTDSKNVSDEIFILSLERLMIVSEVKSDLHLQCHIFKVLEEANNSSGLNEQLAKLKARHLLQPRPTISITPVPGHSTDLSLRSSELKTDDCILEISDYDMKSTQKNTPPIQPLSVPIIQPLRPLDHRSYDKKILGFRESFANSFLVNGNEMIAKQITDIKIEKDAGPAECLQFLLAVRELIPEDINLENCIKGQHFTFLAFLRYQAIRELETFKENIARFQAQSPADEPQYTKLIECLNYIINDQTEIVPDNIEPIVWLSDTIYRLNRLKEAKIANLRDYLNFNKRVLYDGRDELFKQGSFLLGRLLGTLPSKSKYKLKDLPLLNNTLRYATGVIEDPLRTDLLKALARNCNELEGKPNYWKLFLGATLFLGGTILMGLSLAGVAHTAGFSLFGFYASKKIMAIGSGLVATSGAGFYLWGQRKLISKATNNIVDQSEEAQAYFNDRPSN